MNTSALIMMLSVQILVILLTGFFFWKVLTAKPKPNKETVDD